jgi:hypothetical protein
MKKVTRLWMPVLLGVLLTVTLVGVAGARPNARPEASPQLQDHMISPHHCIPDNVNTMDWDLNPTYLSCGTVGPCDFWCPVKPPHEGLIRVQRLAVYAYDNFVGTVCIWLGHVYPKTATEVDRLANQCTSDNASDPQVVSYNPANFKVSQLQDVYVRVQVGSVFQRLYGLKVKYEPL